MGIALVKLLLDSDSLVTSVLAGMCGTCFGNATRSNLFSTRMTDLAMCWFDPGLKDRHYDWLSDLGLMR